MMDFEREIQDIAETVSNCVAGVGIELHLDGSELWVPVQDVVTCRVLLSGACEGEVTLCCGTAFARELTAKMYEMDESELSSDAVRDALGELTHVIGGNVKALFQGSTKVSLPTMVQGDGKRRSAREVATMRWVRMASREKPFIVTVLSRVSAHIR